MTDVYAAVDHIVQSGATKTAVVCEVLKLSRSAYYNLANTKTVPAAIS